MHMNNSMFQPHLSLSVDIRHADIKLICTIGLLQIAVAKKIKMILKIVLLVAVFTGSAIAADGGILGAYFANWAQYHQSPYTFTPDKLGPIAGKLDQLMYSFLYFDQNFKVYTIEPKDPQFIPIVMGYKQSNPNLKVIASIGGWNFPSEMFSKMVSTSANRKAFIDSLNDIMTQYHFDGVDLDWEYPCSKQRTDYVKYSCTNIKPSTDGGGKCPDDTDNLLELVKELRQSLGRNKTITFAGPGSKQKWDNIKLKEMSMYLDYWHVMTYDYTVSDIKDSKTTAPNSPLYTPSASTGAVQWSTDYTIKGYLAAGVPSDKIMLGVPLYGHTWYVPGLTGDQWKKFGLNATIQGDCCGAFQQTYGAKYGKGSQLCGTYMYNEIVAAGVDYYFDEDTKTAIGYMVKDSGDGWTKAGTWFTYNDKNSIEAISQYIKKNKLAGAFIFDTSEDTVNYSTGTFTYELTNALSSGLNHEEGNVNICDPHQCNACHDCCKNYLTNQRDCDACVAITCKK